MIVKSKAFENNGMIPKKHTGFGEDKSPELMIKEIPEGTVSLAIIMDDLDVSFKEYFTHYTIYLVDCFGHGDSEKNPALYRCKIIGDAIADFIKNVVKKECIISGHSSGGILAAYVAGVIPKLVKGVMLENPPFFNAMPGEFENTFVYHDGFKVMHDFLNQTEETEYLVYNIENGYIFNYLGTKFFGKNWAHELAMEMKEKLKAAPGTIPKCEKVSDKSFHGFVYMNKFDKLFAESFYTGEWFEGVTQEEILKSVKCQVVYLKAKTRYGKDGILWAANTDEAADKMMSLLANAKKIVVRSGHDIHYEKPRCFLRALQKLGTVLLPRPCVLWLRRN